MTARTAPLVAALAVLAGCGSLDTILPDAVEKCSQQITPGAAPTDVLFVIDDSPSMRNEQELLQAALSDFIRALDASPIATDLHIGVTTTSVVQWSDAQASYPPSTPSAGLPYAAGTIVAIARDAGGVPVYGRFVYENGAYGGPRILASGQPTLVSDFEANVLVGEYGSAREQPFRAAQLALEKAGAGGTNDGFLRPGARLAIVFLSDEDDCSGTTALGDVNGDGTIDSADCRAAKAGTLLTPTADVAAFLQQPVAGEVRDVVVAAIVGVAPGSTADAPQLSCGGSWCANRACSTAADEGARFVDLLGRFAPDRRQLASICDADFDAALLGFAEVIMPDTLPLDGAPADYRMLVASLERSGFGTIPCGIVPAGSTDAPTADAVYSAPPQTGGPATLTFQNACAIRRGDVVNVKVVCAG
jgi:hypothetical protein